jgi:hypothetical protein
MLYIWNLVAMGNVKLEYFLPSLPLPYDPAD